MKIVFLIEWLHGTASETANGTVTPERGLTRILLVTLEPHGGE